MNRIDRTLIGTIASTSLFLAACGSPATAPEGNMAARQDGATGCEQFESFSGQLLLSEGNTEPQLPPTTTLPPVVLGELGASNVALLDAIEVEQAPDNDSVVFTIVGAGAIGWTARFVQDPRLVVSDAEVTVAGSCILQIDLTGLEQGSSELDVPERISPSGEPSAVVEVLRYPSRVGVVQTFVGIRGNQPQVTIDESPDNSSITFRVAM